MSFGVFWHMNTARTGKTLAVNPKEYLEIFKGKYMNKIHKGIKQGSPGFSCKLSIVNFDIFKKPP